MTFPTDNHGYNVPSEGAQNWHEPLNENFERFETDIEIRDVEANTGDYTPNDGAKFFATDTGTVYIGDGSGWRRVGSGSATVTDRQDARSFDERDLRLTHDGTAVENGTLGLVTGSSAASRPADNRAAGTGGEKDGLKIKPKADLSSLEVYFSRNTKNFSHVYLTETDGTVIERDSTRGGRSHRFSLRSPLSSDRSYYVLIDDERDSSWTIGTYDPRPGPMDYPYRSGAVDITAGVDGSTSGLGETTNYALAFTHIEARPVEVTSGTTHVEWLTPDVSEWQTATFQRLLDGETIEVYVETSSNGGSSWSDWSGNPSGGIDQGVDLSDISASDDIRFRVEFQRGSTSSDPRLNAISRRWLV